MTPGPALLAGGFWLATWALLLIGGELLKWGLL